MKELICESCSKPINEGFQFCPYCGYAITNSAKALKAEQKKVIELKFIYNLVDVVEDKKTLAMLKKLIDKIAE